MQLANTVRERWKGVLFCLIIAIPATLLGKQIEVVGGPVFAILFGMVLALVFPKNRREQLAAGVTYTSKKVLQYAVILLGFGMNLSQILSKGAQSLPIIVATISISLVIAFVLCRVMNVPGKIATLVGVGSSICGGSAIAATAPVIDADDREIAQAISVIFLFNVIAALVFPTLGGMLGLTNEGFGLFAGTAINDTSSVTAAASAWDSMHPGANVLESATVVKLTRTLAIIPITLVLACWQMHLARKAGGDAKSTFSLKRAFPMFVLFFVLASVITTVLQLPVSITAPIKELSKFFYRDGHGGYLAFNTDIVELVKKGGKPIALGFLLLDWHCVHKFWGCSTCWESGKEATDLRAACWCAHACGGAIGALAGMACPQVYKSRRALIAPPGWRCGATPILAGRRFLPYSVW